MTNALTNVNDIIALARDLSVPLEEREILWQIVRGRVCATRWTLLQREAPTSFADLDRSRKRRMH